MNSNMVKPEKFGYLHLVCHFKISLKERKRVVGYDLLPGNSLPHVC